MFIRSKINAGAQIQPPICLLRISTLENSKGHHIIPPSFTGQETEDQREKVTYPGHTAMKSRH